MNILITGSSGFIGSHLKCHFSLKYNIFCIQRKEQVDFNENLFSLDLSNVQNVKNFLNSSFF